MTRITRRQFFEESMIATAVAAAASNGPRAQAQETKRASANETIRHAVIGCRTRGRVHADEFGRQAGVEVAYVCDPDRQLADELAASVEKAQGRRPKAVQDLRAIFDDKSVDTVSIAAPNHWHALAAIWAMQAGKHVYVEKPVSHNVSEGRRIVQVAEKTGRLCQAGTQNRSNSALAAAAEFIRAGKLGDVTFARSIVYGRRESIGPRGNVRGAQAGGLQPLPGAGRRRAAHAPEPPLRLALGLEHRQRRAGEQQHPHRRHLPLADGPQRPGGLGAQRRRAARVRGCGRDAQHADGRPHLRPGHRSCRRSGG